MASRGLRPAVDWVRTLLRPRDFVAQTLEEFSRMEAMVGEEFKNIDKHKDLEKFTLEVRGYQEEVSQALERNRIQIPRLLEPAPAPKKGMFRWEEEDRIAEEEGRVKVHYWGGQRGGPYNSINSLASHIAKDWSTLRPPQWDRAHDFLTVQLVEALRSSDRTLDGDQPLSILVPGCGLGRLVYDLGEGLARHLYVSPSSSPSSSPQSRPPPSIYMHGTEVSEGCLRLIDSIFNAHLQDGGEEAVQFTIHPYVGLRKNNFSRHTRLGEASGPVPAMRTATSDVAADAGGGGGEKKQIIGSGLVDYSFSAMNITEIRDMGDAVDAVVTCFYLDCDDPITQMERIHEALAPGGIFVNFGPLAYHEDGLAPTGGQIETAVAEIGFEMLGEGVSLWEEPLPYYNRPDQTSFDQVWRPMWFVARKS